MLTFFSLLPNFLYIWCFIMSASVSSNMVGFFITKDALKANPIRMIEPQYEQTCTNGAMFYWEPFNESLPYLHMYFNHLAYSISSDSFTNGSSCDICICTHENECYRALDNDNFQVDFIPYCFGNECYMYGVVHSFPLDMKKTFENELNQSYNAPLPYLTNLEPQSAYLKVVSVSCDGFGALKKEEQCEQNVSIYNGTSATIITCDTNTEMYEMTFYLLFTPAPLMVLYVFVLYIFYTSPLFNNIIIFKLMIFHGIFTMSYFLFSILRLFGQIHFLEGYWFNLIYAIDQATAFFSDWTMFLLALNRWDILGGLKLFPSLDRTKFFKVAMIIVILIGIAHIIVGLIPGFRVFTFFVPPSLCSPGIDPVVEVYANFYYSVFCYYELEIALGLSFLLYIWCAISILYQLCKYTKSSKKEVLLFIQTLIPCLLLFLGNVYLNTITVSPGWNFIAFAVFFQFESVHHPVLYLSLNTTLRNEFTVYMKKLIAKITRKDFTTTTTTLKPTTTTSSPIFVTRG